MKYSSVLWLAVRSFLAVNRKGKSGRPLLGAVIGIALSLVPLTVVVHLSQGMINGIMTRFLETYTWHGQTYPFFNCSNEDLEKQSAIVAALPGVTHVVIEKQGFGILSSSSGQTGVTLRALPSDVLEQDPEMKRYLEIKSGTFSLAEKGDIVLGEYIAGLLKVKPGDTITLLTGRTFGSSNRFIPKMTRFTVRAVISTGYQELDRTWSFISLADADRVLAQQNCQNIVGFKVKNPYNIRALNDLLNEVRKTVPQGWFVYSWEDLSGSYQRSYRTTQAILVIIMTMLVLVAILNVWSSLVMLVLERTQEIGIMKCSGTSPHQIHSLFLTIGLLVGITGTLIGLALGIGFSLGINQVIHVFTAFTSFMMRLFSPIMNAIRGHHGSVNSNSGTATYYLDQIPVTFQTVWLILIGAGAILLSALASLYPAARASRVRPLEVIRRH